jgi:hypothetical protein
MKEKKECFDYGEKRVCKVCGCKDNSCKCEMVEEEKK